MHIVIINYGLFGNNGSHNILLRLSLLPPSSLTLLPITLPPSSHPLPISLPPPFLPASSPSSLPPAFSPSLPPSLPPSPLSYLPPPILPLSPSHTPSPLSLPPVSSTGQTLWVLSGSLHRILTTGYSHAVLHRQRGCPKPVAINYRQKMLYWSNICQYNIESLST